MEDNQLTPIEQFMLVQAIFNKAGSQVSTKKTNNMRSRVDDAYRDEYDRTGGKSFSLKFCGTKVGTYSISETRPTEPTETQSFEVTNNAALGAWVRGEDAQLVWDAYITSHRSQFAQWYFETMGELPEGCEIVTHVTQGTPGGVYKGASLRGFDADAVLLKAQEVGLLPTRVAGLIAGGEDE
jgi:hypothetical protein